MTNLLDTLVNRIFTDPLTLAFSIFIAICVALYLLGTVFSSLRKREYPKYISNQLDQWLGTRHRIWFFLSGIGTATFIFWTLSNAIISPSNIRVFEAEKSGWENQLNRKNSEIELLRRFVEQFKDSLQQWNAYGSDFGSYKIPIQKNGWSSGDNTPIHGKRLMAVIWGVQDKTAQMNVEIDTCRLLPSMRKNDCERVIQWTPIVEGGFTPVFFGSEKYYIRCDSLNKDYAILRLFVYSVE